MLTNGPNKFETIVEETRDGHTKHLLQSDFPERAAGDQYRSWNDHILPLYVSYDPDAPAPAELPVTVRHSE